MILVEVAGLGVEMVEGDAGVGVVEAMVVVVVGR